MSFVERGEVLQELDDLAKSRYKIASIKRKRDNSYIDYITDVKGKKFEGNPNGRPHQMPFGMRALALRDRIS